MTSAKWLEASTRDGTHADRKAIVLFHLPNACAAGAVVLLEELGAPAVPRRLNMQAAELRQTNDLAVWLYLAGLFPPAGLGAGPR